MQHTHTHNTWLATAAHQTCMGVEVKGGKKKGGTGTHLEKGLLHHPNSFSEGNTRAFQDDEKAGSRFGGGEWSLHECWMGPDLDSREDPLPAAAAKKQKAKRQYSHLPMHTHTPWRRSFEKEATPTPLAPASGSAQVRATGMSTGQGAKGSPSTFREDTERARSR